MRRITQDKTYNGHPLSNSEKLNQGSYTEILQATQSLFDHMIQRHRRVFFTRFELKYPAYSSGQYPDNNALLSRFIEALMLHCKRRNYDPKYLWVRESSESGQFHYHIMILLNSDIIQNAYGLLNKATELWGRCLNIENASGLVHLSLTDENRYGGFKIIRNAPDYPQVYDQCFERASYLAKCYSKGGLPANVNGFGGSQLR